MSEAKQHLALATEAIDMATSATDPAQRIKLLAMADDWIKAATVFQVAEEIRTLLKLDAAPPAGRK
jgi:hypothetical protein